MPTDYKLHHTEVFLIESLRNFRFLRDLGYFGSNFTIHDIHLHVSFLNEKIDRKLNISYEGDLFISITRKKFQKFHFKNVDYCFEIDQFLETFGAKQILELKLKNLDANRFVKESVFGDLLKAYAEFISHHLNRVINGEKWIDDLVDLSKVPVNSYKKS